MVRTFIQTREFSRNWDKLGFKDEDLRKLELELLENSDLHPVIKGTGGLRKIRIPFANEGKSGSARVCYVDFVVQEVIYLITVYSKNEKENLCDRSLSRHVCRKLYGTSRSERRVCTIV